MSAVISPEKQHESDVEAILTALRRILVDELNVAVPVERLDADMPLQDFHMDSVAMIELISAVEARFDFAFFDSDLVPATFATLRALSEVIAERVSPTASP
jgi:acyl carrier protein